MEKKYFGIKNSVIDPYFEETKRISDLVYDNKDSILYNVLNPEKIETSDNTEIYYAKKLILPSGIEISVDALYNNGVVYNISNEKMSENSDIPHTEAKLIVGNNMINLFINYIDDRYNNNSFLLKDLEKNIEKEKVFENALGKRMVFPKLYGKKSNNKFLKILDNNQVNAEKEALSSIMEYSFKILEKLERKRY